MILSRWQKKKAQSVTELVAVVVVVSALFAASFFFMTIFEVAQNQTMLTRVQAFAELGNYSTYGFQEHGEDDVESDESKVIFMLGENTSGTRVDLNFMPSFDQNLAGEMVINVSGSDDNSRLWQVFRFPRAMVRFSWSTPEVNDALVLRNAQVPLHQVLGIVHNRSISLEGEDSTDDLWDEPGGLYTGSARFSDLSQLAELPEIKGEGLIDNTLAIEALLKEIVRDDPALAEQANLIGSELGRADFYEAALESALISAAIANGLALAGALAGNAFQGGGGLGVDLIENAQLHNFGEIVSFAGDAIQLGAGVSCAFGSCSEDLMAAGQIVGGVGSVASGLSDFGKFRGDAVYQADGITSGLNSTAFGGASKVLGGTGSVLSGAGADQDLVRGFQLGAMAAGFGSMVSGFNENISGQNIGKGSWKMKDDSGSLVWKDGAQWQAVSAAGGIVSQGAGLAGAAGVQGDGLTGVQLLGSGVGLVGSVGSFGHHSKSGDLNFKDFDSSLKTIGLASGLAAGAAGLGAGVAGLAGNDELAKDFGTVGMAASVVTLGATGILVAKEVGKALGDGVEKVGAWIDNLGNEKSGESTSKESLADAPKPIDTRSATKKLEDGLNAAGKVLSLGGSVAITAGGVKTAVDAAKDQKAAAQERYEQEIASANKAFDDEMSRIQEREAQVSGSSSSSSKTSGSQRQASVQTANQMIREVQNLNVSKIRSELPPEKAADLAAALAKLERARKRMQEAEAARLSPSQDDVTAIAMAYSEIQNLVGQTPSSRRVENEGQAQYLSDRISHMELHHRHLTNRMATQVRRYGAEAVAKQMRQMRVFDMSVFSQTRQAMKKLKDSDFEKAFSSSVASQAKKDWEAIQKSFEEFETRLQSGLALPPEQVERTEKRIQSLQMAIDQRRSLPPRFSPEREALEKAEYRDNLKFLKDQEKTLQDEMQKRTRIYQLVWQAEQRIHSRPILVKHRAQMFAVEDQAHQYANEIRDYLRSNMITDPQERHRLRSAEWTWRRLRFETYEDFLDRLQNKIADVKENQKRLTRFLKEANAASPPTSRF